MNERVMEHLIVYRSPLEAWLWESGVGWWLAGIMVPLALVWFALVASWVLRRRRWR